MFTDFWNGSGFGSPQWGGHFEWDFTWISFILTIAITNHTFKIYIKYTWESYEPDVLLVLNGAPETSLNRVPHASPTSAPTDPDNVLESDEKVSKVNPNGVPTASPNGVPPPTWTNYQEVAKRCPLYPHMELPRHPQWDASCMAKLGPKDPDQLREVTKRCLVILLWRLFFSFVFSGFFAVCFSELDISNTLAG